MSDQLDPILSGQSTQEILTDPLLRELYFGTEGVPGLLQPVIISRTRRQTRVTRWFRHVYALSTRSEQMGDMAYAPITQGDIDQFMNPYEDQVVQKSIDDALRAFDQSQIMQKAQNIASGGESAYGSRAGIFAGEQARGFGEGLGSMISGLRSTGFNQALDNAYRQKGLYGQGATFQQGLASLYHNITIKMSCDH